jgi:hypothetical protein
MAFVGALGGGPYVDKDCAVRGRFIGSAWGQTL